MSKRALIVKNPKSKIFYRGSAVEVRSTEMQAVIGFAHIDTLYVHPDCDMSIKTAMRIANHVEVVLIDRSGYFLTRITTCQPTAKATM